MIQDHSQYSIRKYNSQSYIQNQNKTALLHMTNIVMNLHRLLSQIHACRNNYRNLSQQQHHILQATKNDSQVNCLFAGVLAVDSAVRGFIAQQKMIYEENKLVFQDLMQIYGKFKVNYKIGQFVNRFQVGLANFRDKLSLFKIKTSKIISKQVNQKQQLQISNTNKKYLELQQQNKHLKQQIKILQKKYRHMLAQKTLKQSQISIKQSLIQNDYGIVHKRNDTQTKTQLQFQVLQRKLKQLQRQNEFLIKHQNVNYVQLIQELQNQIKQLKIEKKHNQKFINQIQRKFGLKEIHYKTTREFQTDYMESNCSKRTTSRNRISRIIKNQEDYDPYYQTNHRNKHPTSIKSKGKQRQNSAPIWLRYRQGAYI